MNILIFSVSIGNGHDQVAHTLRNEIMSLDPDSRVKVINTISFISPVLDKVILESYLNILKFYPKAWGKLYEKTNKLDPIIDINEISNRLMTGKLKKSINHFNPDAIICTHSFPSSIIAALKTKKKIICPLITIVTDYNIHTSYINDMTDYYVIPHENLSYVMEDLGVKTESILPLGIPIRSEFSLPLNRNELKDKYQITNRRTILVMGGGLGLGEINHIVRELDRKLDNVEILAVAGRNQRLERKLKSLSTRNRLTVFGFVSNIHELMEISDCVITKPGGVTTAEILAKNKPLVIFSPLPGHEYENAEFLLNSGIAVTTSDVRKIPVMINQILSFEVRLNSIREVMEHLKKPYATRDLVNFMLEKYGHHND